VVETDTLALPSATILQRCRVAVIQRVPTVKVLPHLSVVLYPDVESVSASRARAMGEALP
jgi:hypothetical protein